MGKYYYVPSTYKGKKFRRKRRRGGAYRGCGRICGGSLVDLSPQVVNVPTVIPTTPVDIPVAPAQIEQNLLAFPEITDEMIEKARKIIALAEATGKAQPITKKEAGIWSGLKNLGTKVWSGVKTVASNPIVQTALQTAVPLAVGALAPAAMPYVQKGLEYVGNNIQTGADYVGKKVYDQLKDRYKAEERAEVPIVENAKEIVLNTAAIAPKALANAGTAIANTGSTLLSGLKSGVKSGLSNAWRWFRGNGYSAGAYRAGAYRGCGRLKKGSPEARAYMAMLRRMKGKKKKGGAYRAGAYRGCGRKGHLKKGSPEAKAYMAMLRSLRGKKKKSTKKGGARFFSTTPGYLKGGMFPGVKLITIQKLIKEAEKNGDNHIVVNWRDKYQNNEEKKTKMSLKKAKKMAEGTEKMALFYSLDKNGKLISDTEEKNVRSEFLKNNYGKKKWKYKLIGDRRMARIHKQIDSLRRNFTKAKVKRTLGYWAKRSNADLFNFVGNYINDQLFNDPAAAAAVAADGAQAAAAAAPPPVAAAAHALADSASHSAQQAAQATTKQQAVKHATAAVQASQAAAAVASRSASPPPVMHIDDYVPPSPTGISDYSDVNLEYDGDDLDSVGLDDINVTSVPNVSQVLDNKPKDNKPKRKRVDKIGRKKRRILGKKGKFHNYYRG